MPHDRDAPKRRLAAGRAARRKAGPEQAGLVRGFRADMAGQGEAA